MYWIAMQKHMEFRSNWLYKPVFQYTVNAASSDYSSLLYIYNVSELSEYLFPH